MSGAIVLRAGVPHGAPAEEGQLVAIFECPAELQQYAESIEPHKHAHPVDALGPVAAAQAAVDMAGRAKVFKVRAGWHDDPQAVKAAELLVGLTNGRSRVEDKILCPCQRGKPEGMKAMWRVIIVGARRWLVSSAYVIGNAETGRMNVPPLAEPLPDRGGQHVRNLIAICSECRCGAFLRPVIGGYDAIGLGEPTFGRVVAE